MRIEIQTFAGSRELNEKLDDLNNLKIQTFGVFKYSNIPKPGNPKISRSRAIAEWRVLGAFNRETKRNSVESPLCPVPLYKRNSSRLITGVSALKIDLQSPTIRSGSTDRLHPNRYLFPKLADSRSARIINPGKRRKSRGGINVNSCGAGAPLLIGFEYTCTRHMVFSIPVATMLSIRIVRASDGGGVDAPLLPLGRWASYEASYEPSTPRSLCTAATDYQLLSFRGGEGGNGGRDHRWRST